jgi:hypothetical protein
MAWLIPFSWKAMVKVMTGFLTLYHETRYKLLPVNES